MTRPTLTLVSALLCGAGCLPPDSGTSTAGDGEPVVGKLKFNDRVVHLTPEAFADERNGVPREATAKIIADIDLDVRQGKNTERLGAERGSDASGRPERVR